MTPLPLPAAGEPGDAADLTSHIASGDLTSQVALKPGDNSSILQAMKVMQDKLRDIVSDIRASSEYVSNISSEIALCNSNLSHEDGNPCGLF